MRVKVITEQTIEIRLENKEEFDIMWHMMNISLHNRMGEYIKYYKLNGIAVENFKSRLWSELHRIKGLTKKERLKECQTYS